MNDSPEEGPIRSLRRFPWLACALIAAAGALTYANTFGNEFVWDDASSVLLHKHVQDPAKILDLFQEDQHAFGRGQGTFYRPLVSVSFMIDYVLSGGAPPSESSGPATGLSPFLFHLTNTAWHIAAALLLFAVLGRFPTGPFVRMAVPLLYIVHPLHTEAVTYISGRADPMAAAFLFAGLYFVTWDETRKRVAAGALLSAGCYVLGLLCKESAMIFPALAALAIYARGMMAPAPREQESAPDPEANAGTPPAVLRYAPVALAVLVLAGYAALRATVLSFASDNTTPVAGAGERLTEMLQAFGVYLKLIVAPADLHMERTLDAYGTGAAIAGFAGIAALLALTVYGFLRKRPAIALGSGWFLLTWLPISGLYPINAPMAEHWMYVPLAGLLLAVGALAGPFVEHTPPRRAAAFALVALAVAALAFVSAQRNRDWRNNVTIYTATLEDNSDSLRVWYNLAVTYEDLVDNPAGARRAYRTIIDKYEAMPSAEQAPWRRTALEARVALGNIHLDEYHYQEAAIRFQEALSTPITDADKPLVAQAAFGLGECYLTFGNRQQAVQLLKKAIELDPSLQSRVRELLRSGLVS